MLNSAVVEEQQAYDAFVNTGWKQGLGRSEWEGVCAKCHGMKGQGDYGPAISANPLITQTTGLTELLRHGRGRMPPVGNTWTAQQIDALVGYVKSTIYKGARSSGG
jgi:mono/diheme cytochrome c family protein